MNGSLPEKSEPLLSTRYEPLAREAKMPKAQLSRALAVSYFEFQLDILTKLAGHLGRNTGSPNCRELHTATWSVAVLMRTGTQMGYK